MRSTDTKARPGFKVTYQNIAFLHPDCRLQIQFEVFIRDQRQRLVPDALDARRISQGWFGEWRHGGNGYDGRMRCFGVEDEIFSGL